MEKIFVQVAKEKFEYLVQDYGFEILSSVESPRGYFWEGKVVYTTKTAYVCVECTRGEFPSFDIGRTKDISTVVNSKRKYLLPFHLVYEYMITTDDEKKVITSFADQKQAGKIIYQEKYIGREIPFVDSPEKKRELELETYAKLMRKYAEPFLLGDFSQWPAIWEYSVKKGIAQEIDYGRSEYIDVVVPDGNGKFRRVGKKHLYQDKLDYINELKRELGIRS